MTCIVGLLHDDEVYMGTDSAGFDQDLSITIRADAKVFRNGPFLIGFTDSYRMGQLLRYSFVPPEHPEGITDMEYMITKFVEAVRKCLKDGGYARTKDGEETAGLFLIGYRNRLYRADRDYHIGITLDPFCSVGCGAQIAHGAMYATKDKPPAERILLALQAAERFSAGVRGPFVVMKLDSGTEHVKRAILEVQNES